jgi:hypothetical protein
VINDGGLPFSRRRGERQFAVAELAAFHEGRTVIGQVLRAMRCKDG